MHHDISGISALSPAAAKKAALAAFNAAILDPHGADWQAVAYGLHAAMTAKRAAKAEEPAPDGFLPWYDPERETYRAATTTRPLIDFAFSDGVTVSVPAYQKDGKPINIGRACRVAFDLYRAKIRNKLVRAFPEMRLHTRHSAETIGINSPLSVPAIVSAVYRETGQTWNVETLNRETVAGRARHIDGMPLIEADDLEEAANVLRLAFSPYVEDIRTIRDPWANTTFKSGASPDRRYARLTEVGNAVVRDEAEDCPVVALVTGRITTTTKREYNLCDAVEAFDFMPEPEPIRTPRALRLVSAALASTAGVPLVLPVGLRRCTAYRLAA